MPNRMLNADELGKFALMLVEVRARIEQLCGGDAELRFAYRRKLTKELSYDERSKPAVRARLKKLKRIEQAGLCPVCQKALPDKYAVLDRLKASDGYTVENTRLIHPACDTEIQRARGYA